jgi:hypothetical protein
MLLVEGETLLPCLEKKDLAQFEQKLFEFVDDGAFQVGFGIAGLFRQAEGLQHIGFFEQVHGTGDDLALRRQLADALLVAAQGQTFVKAGR